MKLKLAGFCYTILKTLGLSKIIASFLSKRVIYTSEKSFKEEFDNAYLMVTTKAKSSILLNKTVASAYLQSGYWELNNFDYCVLRSLWVHPLFKRSGVGTNIVYDVVNNAKTLGFKYLILTCEEDNIPAQLLYRKCEFQLLKDDNGYTRFVNERTYMEELSQKNSYIYWMKL